jgi:hypothetical protein
MYLIICSVLLRIRKTLTCECGIRRLGGGSRRRLGGGGGPLQELQGRHEPVVVERTDQGA